MYRYMIINLLRFSRSLEESLPLRADVSQTSRISVHLKFTSTCSWNYWVIWIQSCTVCPLRFTFDNYWVHAVGIVLPCGCSSISCVRFDLLLTIDKCVPGIFVPRAASYLPYTLCHPDTPRLQQVIPRLLSISRWWGFRVVSSSPSCPDRQESTCPVMSLWNRTACCQIFMSKRYGWSSSFSFWRHECYPFALECRSYCSRVRLVLSDCWSADCIFKTIVLIVFSRRSVFSWRLRSLNTRSWRPSDFLGISHWKLSQRRCLVHRWVLF